MRASVGAEKETRRRERLDLTPVEMPRAPSGQGQLPAILPPDVIADEEDERRHAEIGENGRRVEDVAIPVVEGEEDLLFLRARVAPEAVETGRLVDEAESVVDEAGDLAAEPGRRHPRSAELETGDLVVGEDPRRGGREPRPAAAQDNQEKNGEHCGGQESRHHRLSLSGGRDQPVWPNPPGPRTVSSSSRRSRRRTCGRLQNTSWAMRSPRSTTKVSSPKLKRMTPISPR